ncbi:MAG: exodeoxyribonuclease VII small subunit [Coriobacteriales bacterium]|jgi:exodeoxyribonuclease VII small subunit|nr:exodeoxyribonuclease VII small subunit [Coriobacteriales bacterium]
MDNQETYGRLRERLEEIAAQIKSKDVPLEKSLDLYEEALRIGGQCAEMIDRTDFSPEELESLNSETSPDAAESDVVVEPETAAEAEEESDGH